MRRALAALATCALLACGLVLGLSNAAFACTRGGNLENAHASCYVPGQDAMDLADSEPAHHYTVHQVCHGTERHEGGNCASPQLCPGPPPGISYELYRDGEFYGTTCLSPDQASTFGEITPGYVAEQWQPLAWEHAELSLAPRFGETYVNFPTAFFTTMSPEPQTITVKLLGTPVTIEATPTTWTWHPGNSTDTDDQWSTSDPGTAYYDGVDLDSLNVFHYLEAGTVNPSVDVTYTGRFQVNGGDWQDIPGDLTEPGTSVNLLVKPATAHLQGY
jgi:hypothetical protein